MSWGRLIATTSTQLLLSPTQRRKERYRSKASFCSMHSTAPLRYRGMPKAASCPKSEAQSWPPLVLKPADVALPCQVVLPLLSYQVKYVLSVTLSQTAHSIPVFVQFFGSNGITSVILSPGGSLSEFSLGCCQPLVRFCRPLDSTLLSVWEYHIFWLCL